MTNIHLGFLEEFSMDRVGPIGVYIFMAGRLHCTLDSSQWLQGMDFSRHANSWPC